MKHQKCLDRNSIPGTALNMPLTTAWMANCCTFGKCSLFQAANIYNVEISKTYVLSTSTALESLLVPTRGPGDSAEINPFWPISPSTLALVAADQTLLSVGSHQQNVREAWKWSRVGKRQSRVAGAKWKPCVNLASPQIRGVGPREDEGACRSTVVIIAASLLRYLITLVLFVTQEWTMDDVFWINTGLFIVC